MKTADEASGQNEPPTSARAPSGTSIPPRKKWNRWFLFGLLALIGLYPAFVFGYTWSHVASANFKGGRHGPLDAYRHALASAIVSHTLGTWAVETVTWAMEWKNKDSNRMDRHNNRIGATIGKESGSLWDIEPAVRAAVEAGTVDSTEAARITWLRGERWREGRFW